MWSPGLAVSRRVVATRCGDGKAAMIQKQDPGEGNWNWGGLVWMACSAGQGGDGWKSLGTILKRKLLC